MNSYKVIYITIDYKNRTNRITSSTISLLDCSPFSVSRDLSSSMRPFSCLDSVSYPRTCSFISSRQTTIPPLSKKSFIILSFEFSSFYCQLAHSSTDNLEDLRCLYLPICQICCSSCQK